MGPGGPVEECDDGNTANGDGCDSSCKLEEGWTCPAHGYKLGEISGFLRRPKVYCHGENLENPGISYEDIGRSTAWKYCRQDVPSATACGEWCARSDYCLAFNFYN